VIVPVVKIIALGVIAFAVANLYVGLWMAPRPERWRREHGEVSVGLVVIVVSLIAAITLLTALHREVPDVLAQCLLSSLLGVAGAETSLIRKERKAGALMHPSRQLSRKKESK
jgi:hypothetical protein